MVEAHGPVDFLILEFPPTTAAEATANALGELVDRGVVALYDLVFIRKDADGTTRRVDLGAGSNEAPAALAAFAGARSGLLGDEDVEESAKALEPDTGALVVVYENRWAVPFVAAARSEGVEVVASARLTAQELMDALDTVEAQD
jgi:hypothetical protein